MAKISLADAFVKSGVHHEIKWADKVIITLDGDYLPFEHQYSGTNLCCEFDRAGLFDEAGTGKTMALHMTALKQSHCTDAARPAQTISRRAT